MYMNGEGRRIEGVEAVVMFGMYFCVGIINKFVRAATGTFAACLVIVPLALFYPAWELAPWLRQHAFSLLIGVFVVQLILPAITKDSGLQTKKQ